MSCPPCVVPCVNPNTQGLTAVISVKVPEPEFEGQTKNRLGNPEVRGIVDQVVNEELVKVFEWHPKVSQSGGPGWSGRGGAGWGGGRDRGRGSLSSPQDSSSLFIFHVYDFKECLLLYQSGVFVGFERVMVELLRCSPHRSSLSEHETPSPFRTQASSKHGV